MASGDHNGTRTTTSSTLPRNLEESLAARGDQGQLPLLTHTDDNLDQGRMEFWEREASPEYLDELMRDSISLDFFESVSGGGPLSAPLHRARQILTRELSRVWSQIYRHGGGGGGLEQHSTTRPFWDGGAAQGRAGTLDRRSEGGEAEGADESRPIPVYKPPAVREREQQQQQLLKRQEGPPTVLLEEKVWVPVNEHPGYNFIGRILGPRGMTVKQLEQESGCKILVRGRGSVRDPRRESRLVGRRGWEHLAEPLHVLITAQDTQTAAEGKLGKAIAHIKKLLTPVENDEHKRKQLMELAIINGTYRPTTNRKKTPATAP